MGEELSLRQLLEQGWRYDLAGARVSPTTPDPTMGNYHGPWLPASEAVARYHETLPPTAPMSDEELRRYLVRQIRSAENQLDSIRAGWGNRVARRMDRFPGKDGYWDLLDDVLPDAEARLDGLRQQLNDTRNRILQRTGRLPGTATNPAGGLPSRATPAAGTTLTGSDGQPPRTVNLRAPAPPAPGPPGAGGTAGRAGGAGLLGGLLAAGEGALVWVAGKLPRFARGPLTRLAVWGPRAVQGAVAFAGDTVVAVLSAPIVIKGALVLGTLIIVGGVIYLVLPSGEVVPLGQDGASYVVVLRSAEGFDGGDVSLQRIEGDVAAEIEALAVASGYTLEVKMGPYGTLGEAREALCNGIVAGSIETAGGVRYATFAFDGRRYGLPENPCGDG